MKILIMKFGGASVSDTKAFDRVANIVKNRTSEYDALVVVVSAMGNMTNHLIGLAEQVHPNPPQREYDMLISVGERVSVSLLAMALHHKGVEAISFTGSQSGILTSSEHTSARIIDVRPVRLWEHLQMGKVVIVAGFQGVSFEKEITTLGRGGSDTSAVALAVALDAEKVEFYKDVAGIYSEDPKLNPNATLKKHLTYSDALALNLNANPILHPRCIELAKKNSLPLSILSFKNSSLPGTLVENRPPTKRPAKFFEQVPLNANS